MKCKNCRTENIDDTMHCKKCGKSFSEVVFKPYWSSVVWGIVVAFIILTIAYGLLGAFDAFVYGLLPSLIVGGDVLQVF